VRNNLICNGQRLQFLDEYLDSWIWKAIIWASKRFEKIEAAVSQQQKLAADPLKYNGNIWLVAPFITDLRNQLA